jgi:hypothetical protein
MVFANGQEVVATLVSVTTDLDENTEQSPLVGFYFSPHGRTQRVPVSEREIQISRCALAVAVALP